MNLLPFQVYNDPTNVNDMRELARQVLEAAWVNRRWKWRWKGADIYFFSTVRNWANLLQC